MDIVFAKEKRSSLVEELKELQKVATAFGISKNRKYFARGTISKEVWDARCKNTADIMRVEKEIRDLNKFIASQESDHVERFNALKEVLSESVSKDDYRNIISEFEKRVKGGHPTRVTLSPNDNSQLVGRVKQIKSFACNVIETLLLSRRGINEYISKNEPGINKADYLKSVSPLNKSCPPIPEIEKLKQTIERL
jgi:hypothetical protein